GQTIEVSGNDEDRVTQLSNGEVLGDKTAGDTVALFRVNMEDLLFDGAFGETGTFNSDVIPDGTETRAFALTVAEGGKASRTIAVSLNITLDQDTETSIYHREGTHPNYHYVKVRDAELPATDIVNASFIAFDSGPVRDLQNAFIWVDHYGLGGSGHDGFVTGTTEGYSEYRLFLKKSQQMGKMGFVIINAQGDNDKRDNISIEFYGAGPAGDKEQKITLKAAYSTTSSTQGLNASGGGTQDGFISMVFRPTGAKKYKALVLEKNITIDAEGSAMQNQFIMTSSESPWYKLNVTRLIHATEGSMIIMRDYSKLTKCYATNEASLYCPITLGWPDANSAATMSRLHLYGGAITGNVVGKQAIHGKPPENANPAVFLHDKPLEEIVYGNTNQKGEPINSIGR
ncbi:MAG: hypothetical protein LBL31_04800, partial [Spirochaetaceae bacterium]|nr:hypothetical protein [Spirochaetaceae bacterium]